MELQEQEIKLVDVESLVPYSDEQVAQLTSGIKEWCKIGDYAVSRCGVIIALAVKHRNKWGGASVRPARVLAQSNDKDGYKLTTMRRLNVTANGQVRVHRLVARCWVGKCPDGHEVNHRDGNKANNHADNLEYVTSSENKHHAVAIGLVELGKNNKNTKPMRVWKEGVELVLYGCADLVKHGFRPRSMHAVANGAKNSCYGWRAEYLSSEKGLSNANAN